MTDNFEKMKNISLQFGLIVNENKTKYMKCTRKESQLNRLTVGNIQIDQVSSFSYLGTIVNENNTLEEEIREGIVKGNKAFYANRTLFKSKLVSRKSKLNLYWSVIVVYGCEIWVLSLSHCLKGKYLGQLKETMVIGELKHIAPNERKDEPNYVNMCKNHAT